MALKHPRKIFLIALLTGISIARLEDSSLTFARSPRQTAGKQQAKVLQIRVQDPGCPGCLLSLKTKLLRLSGVKSVKLSARKKGEIEISVTHDSRISQSVIEARVRFHDLHILNQ